jgi:hypothetical protein
MTVQRTLSGPRAATVAGLVVGALGIMILWASGRVPALPAARDRHTAGWHLLRRYGPMALGTLGWHQ